MVRQRNCLVMLWVWTSAGCKSYIWSCQWGSGKCLSVIPERSKQGRSLGVSHDDRSSRLQGLGLYFPSTTSVAHAGCVCVCVWDLTARKNEAQRTGFHHFSLKKDEFTVHTEFLRWESPDAVYRIHQNWPFKEIVHSFIHLYVVWLDFLVMKHRMVKPLFSMQIERNRLKAGYTWLVTV